MQEHAAKMLTTGAIGFCTQRTVYYAFTTTSNFASHEFLQLSCDSSTGWENFPFFIQLSASDTGKHVWRATWDTKRLYSQAVFRITCNFVLRNKTGKDHTRISKWYRHLQMRAQDVATRSLNRHCQRRDEEISRRINETPPKCKIRAFILSLRQLQTVRPHEIQKKRHGAVGQTHSKTLQIRKGRWSENKRVPKPSDLQKYLPIIHVFKLSFVSSTAWQWHQNPFEAKLLYGNFNVRTIILTGKKSYETLDTEMRKQAYLTFYE